ncbi:hypothetical protein [Paenibacillus periandrae]|uniref:hypothetical protein n=1 Tax=Paenibacillus periandrae TaxID=1761741 RepID=UPI001F08CA84|nr:hypothetical protein [Paenibacillus periandrae]
MDELMAYRYELYERFEKINSPYSFWELQKELVKALLKCEEEIMKSGEAEKEEWLYHQNRLYSISEAMVWSVLESFTIRQLGKFESGKTPLSSQKDTILKIIEKFEPLAKEKIYILADTTRCITTGDVVEVIQSPDKIHIYECKTSTPDEIEEMLKGRTGRQFSKNFWLQEYLERGFGKLYKADLITRTIVVDVTEFQDNFSFLDTLIEECMSNESGSSSVLAEPGLVYVAINTEYIEDAGSALITDRFDFKEPTWTGLSALVEEPRESIFHMPPLAFPISLKNRLHLLEVEVIILCYLDHAVLKDKFRSKGIEFTTSKEGFPELSKGGNSFKFHPRFLNEIMQSFQPIDKVVTQMTSLYDSTLNGLTAEEQTYILERPSSVKEMIDYIHENYILTSEDDTSPGFISIGNKKLKRKPKKV